MFVADVKKYDGKCISLFFFVNWNKAKIKCEYFNKLISVGYQDNISNFIHKILTLLKLKLQSKWS